MVRLIDGDDIHHRPDRNEDVQRLPLRRSAKNQAGWSIVVLRAVLDDFSRRGKHDVVTHPDYPTLRATLPRHGGIAKGYVLFAVELVDRLKQL